MFLVGWNRPAPQTSAGEVLHGSHADVHQRTQVKEHVVEGVDRQASSFISVFQRHDGRVQGVGEVTETWPARFNHFLGALQRVRGFGVRLIGLITDADTWIRHRWGWVKGCLWTYSGDVIGRLSQCLKDVNRRRKIDVLEVMHRIRISSGILFLLHILDHLCLKFCVHRARLDQWQSEEGGTQTKGGCKKTWTEQQSVDRWRKSSVGKWKKLVLKSLIDW